MQGFQSWLSSLYQALWGQTKILKVRLQRGFKSAVVLILNSDLHPSFFLPFNLNTDFLLRFSTASVQGRCRISRKQDGFRNIASRLTLNFQAQ